MSRLYFISRTNGWFGHCLEVLPEDPDAADPEDLERVFTRGQCHALALGIHELTGWAIVGAEWYGECDCCGVDLPNHVAILMPDGRVLDCTGPMPARPDPEGDQRWYWATARLLTPDEIRTWYSDREDSCGYLPPNRPMGRRYAEHILTLHTAWRRK